ncbi:MAG: M48 family metalloprotease [Bdellovibrionales bacterium]
MINRNMTWIFLGLISVLSVYVGKELAGRQGLLVAFIFCFGLNSVIYFFSEEHLRGLFKSKELEGQDPWNLTEKVNLLSLEFKIPPPKVYISNIYSPTAISVGKKPKDASLIVSHSLLEILDPQELEAVVAHELYKIKHNLIFSSTVTSSLLGWVLKVSRLLDRLLGWRMSSPRLGFFTGLMAPIYKKLSSSGLSKKDYFAADKAAVSVTKQPEILAKTLWKLDNYVRTKPEAIPMETAHMFFINPLPDQEEMEHFRIQPPVKERIKELVGQYPI